MAKNKDSIYTRCNDRIKEDETGLLDAKDIAEYNRRQIDSLKMDYDALANFFANFMARISLNQMGYRGIGARSGLYVHPEKANQNQIIVLINNKNGDLKKDKTVIENLKSIFKRKYPDYQMAFDEEMNILTEKTLEEIISELQKVI